MASRALAVWESEQRVELDRVEAARHGDACIVLLAAHFQQFCRDLHTEAAEAIAASTPHKKLVERALLLGRQLDRGNATPAALDADYARLGIALWRRLSKWDHRTPARRRRLEQLNVWRNAVAHRDFRLSAAALATVTGTTRSLAFARSCRASCDILARQFDGVVELSLWSRLGRPPW